MSPARQTRLATIATIAFAVACSAPLFAEEPPARTASSIVGRDYIIGAQDVLNITSHDDPALTGRFTVEADHTFTFPLLGRVRVGGLRLREVETELQRRLVDGGFFKYPQILVSVEQYKSQKVFIVGEVRTPGAYALSGDMRLVEALALAGSTLPTASGEVVIVSAGADAMVISAAAAIASDDSAAVVRVSLRELQSGAFNQNLALNGGDTVFVLKAQNVYVFGQVRNPGAYPLQQDATTVLQGLALAGGVTDRGATSRVEIVRLVDGVQKKMRVKLDERLLPGDTIVVPERFF